MDYLSGLENIYREHHEKDSDINQHFPTLRKYASECSVILEFGVREVVSTWAFLVALPKKLISVDINYHKNIEIVKEYAGYVGVDFQFIKGDDTLLPPMDADLLFIDTWHCYPHMKKELQIHGNHSRRYIICHDTVSCGICGMPSPTQSPDSMTTMKGILPAIEEWLSTNLQWRIRENYTNNNGLLIMERTS
jgi:hypothetical protein